MKKQQSPNLTPALWQKKLNFIATANQLTMGNKTGLDVVQLDVSMNSSTKNVQKSKDHLMEIGTAKSARQRKESKNNIHLQQLICFLPSNDYRYSKMILNETLKECLS